MAAPSLTLVSNGAASALLPPLDWHELSVAAKSATAYRALMAGGALFGLGLVWRCLQQLMRLQQGERANWIWPVVHLIGITLLLSHYQRIMPQALQLLLELGATGDPQGDMFRACAARLERSMAYARELPSWDLTSINNYSIELMAIGLLSKCLHLTLNGLLLSLRALQIFLLGVFVQIGPTVLACSYLGGPFVNLARGWAFGLVQICSWSWCLNVLASTFAKSMQSIADDAPSLPRDIVVSMATVVLVASVPFVAALWMRGARENLQYVAQLAAPSSNGSAHRVIAAKVE